MSQRSRAEFDHALRRGIALFNNGEFWQAHEAWEEAWLHESGERKLFLQGLIQLAAAHYHLQRGTPAGGLRLFESAIARLQQLPPVYCGVELKTAISMAEKELQNAQRHESYPLEKPRLFFAGTSVADES